MKLTHGNSVFLAKCSIHITGIIIQTGTYKILQNPFIILTLFVFFKNLMKKSAINITAFVLILNYHFTLHVFKIVRHEYIVKI